MLQDYKLGFRMLVKNPGLTIAGGLALAIAIGLGAGWYDLWTKIVSPTMPVPAGDRIVLVATQNILTNAPERRVAVRIRHRHAPIPCSVASVDGTRARIAFAEPGPVVTPGQAAVVYDGDYVLGGGWIAGELA